MPATMHTTSPAIMSMDQVKNSINEDSDGNVLKQDLAGLLSSSSPTPHNNSSSVQSEFTSDIKEEISNDKPVELKLGNPSSVGHLSNGDVKSDIDKNVGTTDVKSLDKVKREPNGNPHMPIMLDSQPQGPGTLGSMQHRSIMSSLCMSPVHTGMSPNMRAPLMSQGGTMGLLPCIPTNHQAMMNPMGPGSSPIMGPNGSPREQHLAGDRQLVQQCSEVFVFTTQWANEAAQAVQSGRYKNILLYHMDQPGTKSIHQKNAKMCADAAMFGSQNTRDKMGMMNNSMGPIGPNGGTMKYGPRLGSATSDSVAQWVQQQNQNLQELGLVNNNDRRTTMSNPNFSQMMMDDFLSANNNMNKMQGRVPNEDLTPGQLQRREEQLANLRKIQQMLFPEQTSQPGCPPGGVGHGPEETGPGGQGMMPGDMGMFQQNLMLKRAMVSQQNMMGSPHSMVNSRHNMIGMPRDIMDSQQNMKMLPYNMMNSWQNMIGSSHDIMDSRQNKIDSPCVTVDSRQKMMRSPHSMMDSQQNIIGSPHSMMYLRQNMIGSPQGMVDSRQNMIGLPQDMNSRQNMMGSPHGMLDSQQNLIGSPHGMMESRQNMIGLPHSMMDLRQNMMGSPHVVMDSHQEMMMQDQFSQGMLQYGPGPHPKNMQNLSPSQWEWMRLQQEYVAEKLGIRQQRPMGPNGPQLGPGELSPSYYSSIAKKKRHNSVEIGSPTSPSMNGSMGSPGMNSPIGSPSVAAPELNDAITFQGHPRKNSFLGMDVRGPIGPGPGMSPLGMEPMMQQQGLPLNCGIGGHLSNTSGSIGMKNSQLSLQRVGNPEQFVPELSAPVMSTNAAAKLPPSYTQSTKRKHNDMKDLCKNLQPTLSPQPISYCNQLDDQELIITKQINTAYCDANINESQSSHYTQNNQMVNSPLRAPGSNNGPMSNSSQASNGHLASPGLVSVSQGSGQGPGATPMSGANMRLSHYDPQQQNCSSISNSPTTLTGKSSLSNITSASLANLAKGVENLSNQMQQHMVQGGPFCSIQLQSQEQEEQQSLGSTNEGQMSVPSLQSSIQNSPEQSMVPSSCQTLHNVNNTYINDNLSIHQVNLHGLGHGGSASNYGSNNSSSASMQVQQMNMQQQSATCMSQAGNMTQSSDMTHGSASEHPARPKMHPGSMGMKDGGIGHLIHGRKSPFAHAQNPQQGPTSGHPGLPGYVPSSMGNASIQIQSKAPNTIQYLPTSQPSMLPGNKPTCRPKLDFMGHYAHPMINMEGKVPTSKMQYYPGGNPYGSVRMGGPGGDPRMWMGQDPQYEGQPMSDPRLIDPRMGPSMGGDLRIVPMVPSEDNHMGRHGPRMGTDMGIGVDPRMGSADVGHMSVPRMGPNGGLLMGMGSSSGHMGSVRPGSWGSSFTGPIGPAVQQSLMMRRSSPDLPRQGPSFSPDPMNPSLNPSSPLSVLSSINGNQMTSMSTMSDSMMSGPMCQMGRASTGGMGTMMSGSGSMPIQIPSSRMQGLGMPVGGPYSQQQSPEMQMSGSALGLAPLSSGVPGYMQQHFHQFQQQLYSQGRSRQLSAMDGMMGDSVGLEPGYGHMVPGMGMGMMNMHGSM